jgi:hypothetical protein
MDRFLPDGNFRVSLIKSSNFAFCPFDDPPHPPFARVCTRLKYFETTFACVSSDRRNQGCQIFLGTIYQNGEKYTK